MAKKITVKISDETYKALEKVKKTNGKSMTENISCAIELWEEIFKILEDGNPKTQRCTNAILNHINKIMEDGDLKK